MDYMIWGWGVLLSLVVFILSYKYFLVMLLSVELIIMNMAGFVYTFLGASVLEGVFIYYLVFSVCESVLGLGILVIVIRVYGNDYFGVISMFKL